jgi:hypothetical protein
MIKSAYISLIYLLLLTLGLAGCSKERTYEIRLVNETDYVLEEVSVGSLSPLAVGPQQRSSSIEVTHSKNAAALASEALLSVIIRRYSDATSTYENIEGHGKVVSMSELREGRVNYIYIALASEPHQHPNAATVFTVSIR